MNGIYQITAVSAYNIGHGQLPFLIKMFPANLEAGDMLRCFGGLHRDIVVLSPSGEGWYDCEFITDDREYLFPMHCLLDNWLRITPSQYSGDSDWGPARHRESAYVAALLEENFGGDQRTIIDTVKAIHEIYEGTK